MSAWMSVLLIFLHLNLLLSLARVSYSSVDAVLREKPVVEYFLREKFRGRLWTEELCFKCTYKEWSNATQVYRIHWFIDNTSIFTSDSVDGRHLNETYLTEENGLTKLGVKVSLHTFKLVY